MGDNKTSSLELVRALLDRNGGAYAGAGESRALKQALDESIIRILSLKALEGAE